MTILYKCFFHVIFLGTIDILNGLNLRPLNKLRVNQVRIFCLFFCFITGPRSGLNLALYSGIPPGGAKGTIWSAV